MHCRNCDIETRTIKLDSGGLGCAVCGAAKVKILDLSGKKEQNLGLVKHDEELCNLCCTRPRMPNRNRCEQCVHGQPVVHIQYGKQLGDNHSTLTLCGEDVAVLGTPHSVTHRHYEWTCGPCLDRAAVYRAQLDARWAQARRSAVGGHQPNRETHNMSEETTEKPSVGHHVHYQAYGTPGGEYPSVPRAAIITEVDADGTTVGLCVINPTGLFFNRLIPYADPPKPGCWSWPPRD